MSLIKELYSYSPIIVQNLACTFKGLQEKHIRTSGAFIDYYNWLLKSQWFQQIEIENYQNQKLAEMIQYCVDNIPYYHKLFKNEGIIPSDIRSISDLKYIPILTKEMVRANTDDLINPKLKKSALRMHTSGTSGKALNLFFTSDAIKFRWAVWFRHKNRFGINPFDSYATFTGKVVIPIRQQKPPFWRENYAMKQTIFTMHHINNKTVPYIVDRLNRGGIAYYSGYPSILYSLATLIDDCGLEITAPPKAIFTGAETLLPEQRQRISEVFKSPVTDQYGFSEAAGNASRCECDLFHEDFEYGILECHEPLKDGIHTSGEIIGTSFSNLAMPLLRYQVGDSATWIDLKCKCGRSTKTILRIDGRIEDYVLTPEGNKIMRFDYIFKDSSNIKEAQVVQYRRNEISIRIVKRDGYTATDEKNILKEIKEKISPLFKVNFEYPNEIEREATGKFRAVKSYL